MGNCKAKRNIQFKSSDDRTVDFKEADIYRYIFQTDDIVLFDGKGNYVICDINVFDKEFELLS